MVSKSKFNFVDIFFIRDTEIIEPTEEVYTLPPGVFEVVDFDETLNINIPPNKVFHPKTENSTVRGSITLQTTEKEQSKTFSLLKKSFH